MRSRRRRRSARGPLQSLDVRRAVRSDAIDPIDAHRPQCIAFTSQPEEGNGAERFIVLTATVWTIFTIFFVIEPLYLMTADLNHTAMWLEVDKADYHLMPWRRLQLMPKSDGGGKALSILAWRNS